MSTESCPIEQLNSALRRPSAKSDVSDRGHEPKS